ncbi:hypothetical protein [Heyndrickxia oleronia]|jgi:hypothetical protein|uniref:hypothetical protein n=1 Tax=Heyndrickxia oleronia TaxID=38875 RepID=UPI00242C9754|nr:hypothetical protein [Heyndrickxia oleronia]MCI1763660.1 hypothetical protein [Heyndrickxia oleronia]
MDDNQQHGIYSLINKINNKCFINSTTNIHNFQKYLYKKLNKNKHSNLRLQDAWSTYEESNFEIKILELVEDPSTLSNRKKHWIQEYRSNEIEYGYNLETVKRPWQEKRDEWLKQKTWNVTGSVRDVLKSIIKQLDYNIEFADDRKKHLEKLLDEKNMNWLIDYISSPLFCKKQLKTKVNKLAENDFSLIGLSVLVDYMVFPKYKNKKQKQRYEVRLKNSKVDMNHLRGKEILFGEKEEIKNMILDTEPSNPNVKKSKNQKLYKVESKPKITKEDLNRFPEIKEVYNIILYLKNMLGIGKEKTEKKRLQNIIKEKYGTYQLKLMNKLYRDLSAEILVMKEKLSGTIRFKKLNQGSTNFNYDTDTGYFNDNQDYILVSENKIDFSKEKHILELLNFYSQLKKRVYEHPDSDLWAIMFDLDELIEKTKFEDYMKDILIMKIDGYEAKEIIEEIETKYKIVLTEKRVSEIHNNIIPKMIVDTYLQDREDWIYTYKVKGTYKTCSKCKEVKLLNEKYYYKEPRGKDGFKSKCKMCT